MQHSRGKSAVASVALTVMWLLGLPLPAHAAEETLTLEFESGAPYVVGQEVGFTVTSSDPSASGDVTVEILNPDTEEWLPLHAATMSSGVATGSSEIGPNAVDGPVTWYFRAVKDGLYSGVVEFIDQNLEWTADPVTVSPGSRGTLVWDTNAQYYTGSVALYRWERFTEEYILVDPSLPMTNGSASYRPPASETGDVYCIEMYSELTATPMGLMCALLDVFQEQLSIHFNEERVELDGEYVEYEWGTTLDIQFRWGGYGYEDDVTLQKFNDVTGAWRDTAMKTSTRDGVGRMTWTPQDTRGTYRFKFDTDDIGVQYSVWFRFDPWVPITVNHPTHVLENKPVRVTVSTSHAVQALGPQLLAAERLSDGTFTRSQVAFGHSTSQAYSFSFTPKVGYTYHLASAWEAADAVPDSFIAYPGSTSTSESIYSTPLDLTVVRWSDVELSASPSAEYVPGSSVQIEFTTNIPVTGSADLWYRSAGGDWVKSSTGVAFVDGVGTRTVSPSGVREYRVRFAGQYSPTVTLTPGGVPVATVAEPEAFVPGASVALQVSLDEAASGVAELWYRDGGTWRKSSRGVAIVDGEGTRVVSGVDGREFKVRFGGLDSNTVVLAAVVPEVTLSGASEYVPGESAVLTVAVDPALSGEATLMYRTNGGAWRTAGSGVDVVDGAGSRSVNPTGVREYKVVMGGAESNVVTMTAAGAPTVTATAPATYVPGESVTMTITVDPAISGNAQLWYRSPGGTWRASSVGATIVDGSGTRVLNPSATREYRVLIAGVYSNAVTLSPADS